MTHRAETILSTVETLLTGLATTGANVQRAQVWPVDAFPAISIYKSDDVKSEESDNLGDLFNREMTVNIILYTIATGNVETALNQIAAEVFAALTADKTLGLAYVFDTALIGDNEPSIEASQDTPVASMVSVWLISYEHMTTDAET